MSGTRVFDTPTVRSSAANTLLDLLTRDLPPDVSAFRTAGYSTPGDGGDATWVKTQTLPGHNAWRMDTSGNYWELSEVETRPQMIGGFPVGTTGLNGTGVVNGDPTEDHAYYFRTLVDFLVAKFGGGVLGIGPGKWGCYSDVEVKSQVLLDMVVPSGGRLPGIVDYRLGSWIVTDPAADDSDGNPRARIYLEGDQYARGLRLRRVGIYTGSTTLQNRAQALAMVKAFRGAGVSLGNGTTAGRGQGVLEDATILGFKVGVLNQAGYRWRIAGVKAHCLTVIQGGTGGAGVDIENCEHQMMLNTGVTVVDDIRATTTAVASAAYGSRSVLQITADCTPYLPAWANIIVKTEDIPDPTPATLYGITSGSLSAPDLAAVQAKLEGAEFTVLAKTAGGTNTAIAQYVLDVSWDSRFASCTGYLSSGELKVPVTAFASYTYGGKAKTKVTLNGRLLATPDFSFLTSGDRLMIVSPNHASYPTAAPSALEPLAQLMGRFCGSPYPFKPIKANRWSAGAWALTDSTLTFSNIVGPGSWSGAQLAAVTAALTATIKVIDRRDLIDPVTFLPVVLARTERILEVTWQAEFAQALSLVATSEGLQFFVYGPDAANDGKLELLQAYIPDGDTTNSTTIAATCTLKSYTKLTLPNIPLGRPRIAAISQASNTLTVSFRDIPWDANFANVTEAQVVWSPGISDEIGINLTSGSASSITNTTIKCALTGYYIATSTFKGWRLNTEPPMGEFDTSSGGTSTVRCWSMISAIVDAQRCELDAVAFKASCDCIWALNTSEQGLTVGGELTAFRYSVWACSGAFHVRPGLSFKTGTDDRPVLRVERDAGPVSLSGPDADTLVIVGPGAAQQWMQSGGKSDGGNKGTLRNIGYRHRWALLDYTSTLGYVDKMKLESDGELQLTSGGYLGIYNSTPAQTLKLQGTAGGATLTVNATFALNMLGAYTLNGAITVTSSGSITGAGIPWALQATTSGAATATLTRDGAAASSTNVPSISPAAAKMFLVSVVAERTAGSGVAGDCAVWDEVYAAVERPSNNASTALKFGGGASIAPTASVAGLAGLRIAITGDTTTGGLKVAGTGVAGYDLAWRAVVTPIGR